jgi:hypothetical protein
VAGLLASSIEEAHAAVAQPGALDRTVHLSFGDTSGQQYVVQLTADLAIHAWDLARATGQDDTLDLGAAALLPWAEANVSRFATVHASLDRRARSHRLSAGRACSGWSDGPRSCEHAAAPEAGRRGQCGHGHLPQMVALTSVPDGELWRSFPESNRSDILGLLTMLLERWAVSAGLAAEETGGEHGASG